MRTVILHDHFSIRGGGERLVLTLAQGLQSDLAFGYWEPSSFPLNQLHGHVVDLDVRLTVPVVRVLTLGHAFRRYGSRLGGYDNRIYSGICAPLAVMSAPPGGKNIYYCHTPPRFLFDKRDHYRSRHPLPVRLLSTLIYARFQASYRAAVNTMDLVVANSNHVQKRIRRYLARDCAVVYPPCDVDYFRWLGDDGYYLSMARHDALKRVDRIISAFRQMPDKRLVVTSDGPETRRLHQLACAAPNITFTGPVSDETLRELVGRSTATVYVPEDEDFGMSAIESMSAGKPVIGVNEGGLAESVLHERTGLLVQADPSADDIISAVLQLGPGRAASMRLACRDRAEQFSSTRFIRQMADLLEASG